MEIKNIEEKENPLFKRKEIKVEIESEITPKNEDVGKLLSEKFSTPEENIKIKRILGKFGSKIFNVIANIYQSKEDKEKTEHKSKKNTKGTATGTEDKSNDNKEDKQDNSNKEDVKLEQS